MIIFITIFKDQSIISLKIITLLKLIKILDVFIKIYYILIIYFVHYYEFHYKIVFIILDFLSLIKLFHNRISLGRLLFSFILIAFYPLLR